MLLVLTGDIQIGKTRWLQASVDRLEAAGVGCEGVVAPGVWRPQAAPEGGYEKLGIDNVLLPGGERVPFARRVDLACQAGAYNSRSQSARAGLGWAIDDAAIARVNAHFRKLADACQNVASLLIVDELGRLELMRGEGLVEAMALLDRGPTRAFPHALVVVREDLLPLARERLAPVWGAPVPIHPDDAGVDRARAVLGV